MTERPTGHVRGISSTHMPVLAVGRKKPFGPMIATVVRFAAGDVTEAVIPDSGDWIKEENSMVLKGRAATLPWRYAPTPNVESGVTRGRRRLFSSPRPDGMASRSESREGESGTF